MIRRKNADGDDATRGEDVIDSSSSRSSTTHQSTSIEWWDAMTNEHPVHSFASFSSVDRYKAIHALSIFVGAELQQLFSRLHRNVIHLVQHGHIGVAAYHLPDREQCILSTLIQRTVRRWNTRSSFSDTGVTGETLETPHMRAWLCAPDRISRDASILPEMIPFDNDSDIEQVSSTFHPAEMESTFVGYLKHVLWPLLGAARRRCVKTIHLFRCFDSNLPIELCELSSSYLTDAHPDFVLC